MPVIGYELDFLPPEMVLMGKMKWLWDRPLTCFLKTNTLFKPEKCKLMLLILHVIFLITHWTCWLDISLSANVGLDWLQLSYFEHLLCARSWGKCIAYTSSFKWQKPCGARVTSVLEWRTLSSSKQAVQGPMAGTQHCQDLHPGLSDAEACVYNNCINLTWLWRSLLQLNILRLHLKYLFL